MMLKVTLHRPAILRTDFLCIPCGIGGIAEIANAVDAAGDQSDVDRIELRVGIIDFARRFVGIVATVLHAMNFDRIKSLGMSADHAWRVTVEDYCCRRR